jgi:hypothetical protein
MTRPIQRFEIIAGTPLALRASGSGWMMRGSFRVHILLRPQADCRRYEYRQYIRGTATVQRGTFPSGLPPSPTNWQATGPLEDVASTFEIPGGLPRQFREDGQRVGGRVLHFGYRTSPAVVAEGTEDRYLPRQDTGCEYRGMDTFGLSATTRVVGLRIRLSLAWQGRIIDTRERNRVIGQETWHIDGDDIIV